VTSLATKFNVSFVAGLIIRLPAESSSLLPNGSTYLIAPNREPVPICHKHIDDGFGNCHPCMERYDPRNPFRDHPDFVIASFICADADASSYRDRFGNMTDIGTKRHAAVANNIKDSERSNSVMCIPAFSKYYGENMVKTGWARYRYVVLSNSNSAQESVIGRDHVVLKQSQHRPDNHITLLSTAAE
jgi:hypothetical protein